MSILRATHRLPTGQVLEVWHGDLTQETTDAIVNAANEYLLNGAGVAGAILRHGGDSIQDECDRFTDAFGPVPTGQVALTNAGSLPARYVIHAVGPIWEDGQHDEPNLLRSAILNSLAKASELHLQSIAFPAISSGIFGFPKALCAETFMSTVTSFLGHSESTLMVVRFTNIDELTTEVFAQALQAISS